MKNIIVTGGLNGLGNEIVEKLISNKENIVYVVDKNSGFDASSPEQINEFLNYNKINHVDVLINNAGINAIMPLGQITKEFWDSVLDVNAWAIINMTQCTLSMMNSN
jgi:NAD(P)-dependent dehydrogenase (short-subunit alcohol dehydrogenase family)